MTSLVGTGPLVRGIVRRDRVRMLVWMGGIVAMTASSAAGVKGLYATTAELQRAAALIEGNAVAIAFNGPDQGLGTIGGRIAFETGAFHQCERVQRARSFGRARRRRLRRPRFVRSRERDQPGRQSRAHRESCEPARGTRPHSRNVLVSLGSGQNLLLF